MKKIIPIIVTLVAAFFAQPARAQEQLTLEQTFKHKHNFGEISISKNRNKIFRATNNDNNISASVGLGKFVYSQNKEGKGIEFKQDNLRFGYHDSLDSKLRFIEFEKQQNLRLGISRFNKDKYAHLTFISPSKFFLGTSYLQNLNGKSENFNLLIGQPNFGKPAWKLGYFHKHGFDLYTFRYSPNATMPKIGYSATLYGLSINNQPTYDNLVPNLIRFGAKEPDANLDGKLVFDASYLDLGFFEQSKQEIYYTFDENMINVGATQIKLPFKEQENYNIGYERTFDNTKLRLTYDKLEDELSARVVSEF